MPSRICVVGLSGSGKTHLAARLADRLGLPHVELDGLYHGPNWTAPDSAEFRQRVETTLASYDVSHGGWVVDGNYRSHVEDALAAAELTVWLDYPRWLVMRRLVPRSLARRLTGRELWNGNRESWRALLSRDPHLNIVVWSWTRHGPTRERLAPVAAANPTSWVRLTTPRETERWLARQTAAGETTNPPGP